MFINWTERTIRGAPPGLNSFLWVLHRFTGLIIVTFLLLHIIAFADSIFGVAAANLNAFLNSKVVVVVTVESLIFHMFNGIKIIVTDFLPFADQKKLAAGVLVLFVLFSIIFFEVGL